MRRTVLGSLALAATAVLAGALPAFADGADPTVAPSVATPAPAEASTDPTPAPAATTAPSSAPSAVPSQVDVVPSGAADTGSLPVSQPSEGHGALIGGGAVAVFAAGGAGVYFVRRRRTTGA
ncbi:Tat pathway signal sequence domain protein [Streptomyces sp. NBC_01275]|uniref:Tat pathway signal sequence domain protein n=1 Tax=Streptomyces sp. NBC_01275 TaxID=2903807 RepID=UPI00225BD059|nr:Tat pathway signal sequence domain protein [Streptomyces sp. NBC_01275]MCX4765332.1 Tat pathway signal sequence domain protein [Streptomyces sp. NBC_01275]